MSAGDPELGAAVPGWGVKPADGTTLVFEWDGPLDRVPEQAAPWLATLGLEALRESDVVVDRVHLQVFEGTAIRADVRLAGVNASVVAFDDRVIAGRQALSAAARVRMAAVLGAGATAATVVATIALAYGLRHSWYFASSQMLALMVLVPALGLAAVLPATAFALPGRIVLKAASAGPLVVGLFVALIVSLTGRPSIEHAEQTFAAGDVRHALNEATAALDLGIGADRAAALVDRIHLDEVAAAADPQRAWQQVEADWAVPEARGHAQALVLARTLEAVDQDQERGDFTTTAALLLLVPEALRDPAWSDKLVRADLHRADDTIQRMDLEASRAALASAVEHGATEADLAARRHQAVTVAAVLVDPAWSAIRSTKKPLADRQKACVDIRAPLRFRDEIGLKLDGPTSAETTTRCDEVDRAVLAAKDKAEKQRVAAEAKTKADAQRKSERAARARASTSVICNDGTTSPSCTCGGSYRGCCSHHGGVSGCGR